MEGFVPEKLKKEAKMAGEIPFGELFEKDGRKIIFVCDRDRGVIQLADPANINFVTVNVSWDGKVDITTCRTFPRSSLQIRRLVLGQKGKYDTVQLVANLEVE